MSAPGTTKQRLLRAATRLFAERGFHASSLRDIAARAGVNVAAANYHYGSKKQLYLEVLRAQFAEIRGLLARRGLSRPPGELDGMSRPELERLLAERVRVMLEILVGPPPGLHGTLMQRELADPSEALPVIVRELIEPFKAEMEAIVTRLEPGLSPEALEPCVLSIVGQAQFYRFAMPLILRVAGLKRYPKGFARERAEHIAAFSLGGMAAVSGRARPRPGAR